MQSEHPSDKLISISKNLGNCNSGLKKVDLIYSWGDDSNWMGYCRVGWSAVYSAISVLLKDLLNSWSVEHDSDCFWWLENNLEQCLTHTLPKITFLKQIHKRMAKWMCLSFWNSHKRSKTESL